MFLEGVSPEYFPLFSQSSGALGGQPNGVIDTNNPSLNQNQMMPDGTVETAKQVCSPTHPIFFPLLFTMGGFLPLSKATTAEVPGSPVPEPKLRDSRFKFRLGIGHGIDIRAM